MRIFIFLIFISLAASGLSAQDLSKELDNNTAFYEGEKVSYIISPPDDFVMVEHEAEVDGYAFAFIPDGEKYDSASVRIGVNIFRIKEGMEQKITLEDVIHEDTTALREHFGETLIVYEVDSIITKSYFPIRNLYLNDTTRFIPNVMMSYLRGGNEILIFGLTIDLDYPRFMAEQIYTDCLKKIKVLVKGKLETG
ncbi:MAG: hypothetical protein JSV52_03125 [Candidatus Zixiibacteriota bacterium]|nr:MAG: hypothetical protein JSV52_03125 [candidate division Zixibacteria bacterium]